MYSCIHTDLKILVKQSPLTCAMTMATGLVEHSGSSIGHSTKAICCSHLRKIVLRTRGHEVTLVKDQCRLDIRKYSLSQKTINEWNKLSTDRVNVAV